MFGFRAGKRFSGDNGSSTYLPNDFERLIYQEPEHTYLPSNHGNRQCHPSLKFKKPSLFSALQTLLNTTLMDDSG